MFLPNRQKIKTVKKLYLTLSAVGLLLAGGCSHLRQDGLGAQSAAQNKDPAELSPYGKEDPRTYLPSAAREAEKEGDYYAAAGFWGALADQYPDFKPGIVGFSKAARRIGASSRALGYLYAYQVKDESDEDIAFEIAKNLHATGKYRDALEETDNLIKRSSDNWRYYSFRGIVADSLNYESESEFSYQKALKISPDNPHIMNNYAISLKNRGNLPAAARIISAASAQKEAPAAVHENYAEILMLQGRDKEAMKLLEERFGPDKAGDKFSEVRKRLSQPAYWRRAA